MPTIRVLGAILTVGGNYKPGDQPPEGYLDWHDWAEVQARAGLKQQQCGRCLKGRFPQELSPLLDRFIAKRRNGTPVTLVTPVCNDCAPTATSAQPDALL